jgi:hypothetical protein
VRRGPAHPSRKSDLEMQALDIAAELYLLRLKCAEQRAEASMAVLALQDLDAQIHEQHRGFLRRLWEDGPLSFFGLDTSTGSM